MILVPNIYEYPQTSKGIVTWTSTEALPLDPIRGPRQVSSSHTIQRGVSTHVAPLALFCYFNLNPPPRQNSGYVLDMGSILAYSDPLYKI